MRWFFIMIGVLFMWFFIHAYDAKTERKKEQTQIERELAVSEIPEGLEQRSIMMLEQEIREVITPLPTGILILPSHEYLSNKGDVEILPYSSYSIYCSPRDGISITFRQSTGEDDTSSAVYIKQYMVDLPFHEDSLAAKKLNRVLCESTSAILAGYLRPLNP